MQYISFRTFQPARVLGPAFLLLGALLLAPATSRAADAAGDDHQQAVAALADVKAAVNEIVLADSSYATNRDFYHRASQRAINALAGEHGFGYAADLGTSGDAAGAIGHIDALLNRQSTPVWAISLHGAEANIRAAIVHLGDANHARELMDYEIAVSRALAYLKVAQGRPTETGLFGGLEGALANTVLGVPADAQQLDACAGPSSAAPAYGTHDGYLAWVTVPSGDGQHVLAEDPGATALSIQNGTIALHTAAAALVAEACSKHADAASHATKVAQAGPEQQVTPAQPAPAASQATSPSPAASQPAPASSQPAPASSQAAPASSQAAPASSQAAPAASQTASPSPQATPAALDTGSLPALYTKAQAASGSRIFAEKCVSCHGANLQGTAGPSVAGNDFLVTAQHNGWTLQIIRYIVFKLMPRNSPSSLSPADNADVMAFLLASDCYPAGSKPFPSDDEPAFANIKFAPVPGHHPGEDDKGVCKVQ